MTNPDGRTGIALHVDDGADSVMTQHGGFTWGSRSAAKTLTHANVIGVYGGGGYNWSILDLIKRSHFAKARERVLDYVVSGSAGDREAGDDQARPATVPATPLRVGDAEPAGTKASVARPSVDTKLQRIQRRITMTSRPHDLSGLYLSPVTLELDRRLGQLEGLTEVELVACSAEAPPSSSDTKSPDT
ncbi:MAG: hypothetical protein Q7J48_16270 [Nocardioides sp.]|nr:hypothetical protein [Nocardioides sp.]